MELTWAEAEMQGAQVWDRRCRRSLSHICAGLATHPCTAFSVACGPAARQAAHRIFAHDTTTVGSLLQGHYTHSRLRAQAHPSDPAFPWLLVVQDTTVLDYSSHHATTGLGPINNELHQRGLLAHSALVLPWEGPPLGLAHLAVWARDPQQHGRSRDQAAARARPVAEKESQKWLAGLRGVEAALGAEIPVLLIQDREGDVFEFLHAPRQANVDLLVRAASPRQVLLAAPPPTMCEHRQRQASTTLFAAQSAATVCGPMTVAIPRAPGRKARTAELTLRRCAVWLLPPRPRKVTQESRQRTAVRVWVVWAEECSPQQQAVAAPPVATDTTAATTAATAPASDPVAWVLVTTLPVDTAERAAQLVRAYARRWVIEQLHLVLKSGLRVERLQFDDATSLQHAIALCYVVAWRVLYARDVARFAPDAPAEWVVSPLERTVLEAAAGQRLLTTRAVVRAVAHLAGFPHYPSAGEPGVRSLWAGFRRLEGMVLGWELAHQQHKVMRQD